MNLRETIESDLLESLESDYWLPVVLIAPDGVIYDKSNNDPTKDLGGQVLYDSTVTDLESGMDLIVHKPVVTLRLSSLERVPLDGEKWAVKIPISPSTTADLKTFLMERPTEPQNSIGFIRLYLMEMDQS